MRFSQSVSAILFMGISLGLQAEALDAWLDKMMHAMKTSNYEGTLVIRQADKLQALHVQHGMDEQGSMWESLESLNGEARKVIRQNDRVTTIFPARELVIVSQNSNASSFHNSFPSNIEILKNHYTIKLAGEDRVARMPAQVLELMPRDQYRYGFRYWLAKDSGLLLKCDLLDEQGNIVEQLMFSDLKMLEASPQKQSSLKQPDNFKVVDLDAGHQQAEDLWIAHKLPNGFMLTRSSIKPSANNQGVVHHMVYSDGIASVSVFIEKHHPDEKTLLGESRMGAVNAFSLHHNSDHITAIGEVPLNTVRMIANSVQRVK